VTGGIEMTLRVNGTVELASWVLSFGDQAEVRAPPELRERLAAELARAMGRYAGKAPSTRAPSTKVPSTKARRRPAGGAAS
jgi:hypothetical protein